MGEDGLCDPCVLCGSISFFWVMGGDSDSWILASDFISSHYQTIAYNLL